MTKYQNEAKLKKYLESHIGPHHKMHLAKLFGEHEIWVVHKLRLHMYHHVGSGYWSS